MKNEEEVFEFLLKISCSNCNVCAGRYPMITCSIGNDRRHCNECVRDARLYLSDLKEILEFRKNL